MAKDGAFDDAINGSYSFIVQYIDIHHSSGVPGVIHAESILSFSTVIGEIVHPIINSTLSILCSAATQSIITQFILTAGDYTRSNEVYSVKENS